jgi:hypothetical protein
VHAPEQQGDRAGEIDQGQGHTHFAPPMAVRTLGKAR